MKRFFECLVPVSACNLRCSYCYVSQQGKNNNEMPMFLYSPEHIGRALSISRLGGRSLISITGAGETLLPKELPAIVYRILEQGHFVNITTNGTLSVRFKEIMEFPKEYLERVHFSFSLHYVELCRIGKLEDFFSNINLVRNAGCSFLVQINLSDEYMPLWNEILRVVKERTGVLPQVALTRDESSCQFKILTKKTDAEYIAVAREASSPLFEVTLENFMKKRREFCYAGDWSGHLNLATGVLSSCYDSGIKQDIFSNLTKPIQFEAIGCNCQSSYCINSSHFMSLGVIPSIEMPSYEALRNRPEGRWYSDKMSEFLNARLYNYNIQYGWLRKMHVNLKYYLVHTFRKLVSVAHVFPKVALQKVIRILDILCRFHSRIRQVFYCWKTFRWIVRCLQKSLGVSHRVIFIGSPLHINLGDHAIALAMMEFFKTKFPTSAVVEIPSAIFAESEDVFRRLINPNDRIAVIGGGFLGTLWLNEEEMVRSVIRIFPENRIVIFPQTVFFDPSADGCCEKEVTRKLYQSHEDLHLFVRDHSIEFVRRELCGGRFNDVRPAPDIVLFMDRSMPEISRSGVVLCFRLDKEKAVSSNAIDGIRSQVSGLGETVRKVDTVMSRDISLNAREVEVSKKLDEFRSARLVITDRLHGMIFSAITGTPCIALNNSSGKVGGVWSLWMQHLRYIKFAESASEVFALIPEMLAMGGQRYNQAPLERYWREIADVIR